MASKSITDQTQSGSTRFEVTAEPFGRFLVFDNRTGLPAEIEARTLIGLDREEAVVLCRFLNAHTGGSSAGGSAPPEPRRSRRWPPRVVR